MSSRGPYRHHAPRFKLQLCQDIRSGVLTRREAQKNFSLSANLIQRWLTLFDRGGLEGDEVEATAVAMPRGPCPMTKPVLINGRHPA